MRQAHKHSSGFTMIELLVSLALGMIVVAAAVQLFSSGLKATFTVSQRAEMQQDIRAAQNMMTADIGLAGAGMPSGGLALESGGGKTPRYGCDQSGKCYLGTSNSSAISFPSNYLYGIIPGNDKGIAINASQGATDIITLDYVDTTLALNCYQVTFVNANGTQVKFSLPTTPLPGCSNSTTQAVTDSGVGLTAGDVVMFTYGSNVAVAEVSSASGSSSPYTVNFNDSDPMYLQQSTATLGDIKQVANNVGSISTNTVAQRVLVITYYLDQVSDPTGLTGATPRLMKQVSGHTPIPLAENVAYLQFTYDTYDSNGNLLVATNDAGASQGVSPSMIRNVNIAHMTLRSQIQGTSGYQGFDVSTSVSARNLTYSNRYQ
ncbi:MAG TPA: prepilin-type N-terminal cleavage/methylation domain-containing protein [Terriglobales bacterium]|nr:prepilin-type N-terminal cleavage/methylation domain-containing protein [Terriglobales bacterium]